jgi:hypothetical protein
MADTPSQNFGPLPDTLTFGPFGPDGDIIVHIENLVLGCPPYVENIGVPFVCSGDGYGSVTLLEGAYIFLETDSGYFTLRDSEGTITTYASGDDITVIPGPYCLWASDVDGELTGVFIGIEIDGFSAIELAGLQDSGLSVLLSGYSGSSLSFITSPILDALLVSSCSALVLIDVSLSMETSLTIADNPILSTVLVPVSCNSTTLIFSNNALDTTSVDAIANCASSGIPGGVLRLEGGTNAAPTIDSAENRGDLLAAGWFVSTN